MIVIGNGAQECVIRRSIVRRAGVGIQFSAGGTGWVEDCVIESARVGGIDMSYGSAIVRRCRIGVTEQSLGGAQGRLEVYDSILEGGTYATINSTTTIIVRNSHILNAGGLSVKGLVSAPNEYLDLRENWWGTSDASQIASWIDDQYGTVTWQPIQLGPVPTESTSIGELKASFGID